MPTFDYDARQEKLRAIPGVDAVAVVPGRNMYYFTGLDFHLSERPTILLFTPEGRIGAIVPRLEIPRLQARPDLEIEPFEWGDTEGFADAFKRAVQELGLSGKTIGVDGLTMRVSEWLAFQQADSSLQVKAVERDLIGIRAIKTPTEIDLMRQAIRISEQALADILPSLKPGMTERQIGQRLTDAMAAGGADGVAFIPLVQSGPNSALPHGEISDRPLGENDLLLIDYGAAVQYYPADITRTFCLGTPTAKMEQIYATVLAANQAGIAAVKPGATMGSVDKATRDVIEAAGYGEYFFHRTGHGLGMDGHELIPQIASGVTDELKPGMSFTIEPGIYISGFGGVRIEDNVVVTETGVDVLTSFPKASLKRP